MAQHAEHARTHSTHTYPHAASAATPVAQVYVAEGAPGLASVMGLALKEVAQSRWGLLAAVLGAADQEGRPLTMHLGAPGMAGTIPILPLLQVGT